MRNQKHLMGLAALFLFLFAVILTLSPIVKYRSWQVDLRWFHWIGFVLISAGFFFLQHTLVKCSRNVDPILLPVIYLLTGWGLLTIFRLGTFYGFRQTLWILASLFLTWFLVTRKQSILALLQKYNLVGLFLGLGLLVATIFLGIFPGGNGPTLWLRILGVNIQPSEFLKLFFIIFLSAYFAKEKDKPRTLKTILPTLVVFLVISGILVFQNDFGTTLIFLIIYATYLFFYTGQKRVFGLIVLAFLLFGGLGYHFFDIFSTRISGWLSSWEDPSGGAYQVIQSILSIAAGGVLGTGPGLGFPNVVPLAHSDFIFSAIAEETGLIGTSCFLICLALLLVRGYKIARNASTPFQSYIAAGVTTYLITQAVLIIGGNTRLLPITGVTLPFVSYGGSSYVSAFLAISMLFCMDLPKTKARNLSKQNNLIKKPLFVLGSLFILAFLAIEGVLFWWSFVKADDLQKRSDNPRLIYADQFVERGTIYDRDFSPLAVTQGEVGSFYRYYPYPQLSTTIGFSHSRYGHSGIEEYLNSTLRGFQGYPQSYIWFTYLAYDQPPKGVDVQLTLDLDIQRELDTLITGFQGAGIVLDAETGEILASSSQPGFDANALDENWSAWNRDEGAPFLNRVMQSSYPAGSILIPFLLDESQWQEFSSIPIASELQSENSASPCLLSMQPGATFRDALQSGCQTALFSLIGNLTEEQIEQRLTEFGFFSTPSIGLPLSETVFGSNLETPIAYIAGTSQIRFSPLMVAKATALISDQGEAVDLSIILSPVEEKTQDSDSSQVADSQTISSEHLNFLFNDFLKTNGDSWEYSGFSEDENGIYQWMIQGTLPREQNKRTIVVIVLENADAAQALHISNSIYDFVQQMDD
ncbi:MAG: FtsW/RodA/SpoVE family cell cycle protein [Anaerolineaceae bacterium]